MILNHKYSVAIEIMRDLCGPTDHMESKTVTPKCRSASSVGMVQGNQLNEDVGHYLKSPTAEQRKASVSTEANISNKNKKKDRHELMGDRALPHLIDSLFQAK